MKVKICHVYDKSIESYKKCIQYTGTVVEQSKRSCATCWNWGVRT